LLVNPLKDKSAQVESESSDVLVIQALQGDSIMPVEDLEEDN